MTLQVSDLEDDIALFIKNRLPQAKIETFFDIGANIGWVTLSFLRTFPDLKAWAFEPIEGTFDEMVKNLSRFVDTNPFPRTTCIMAGFGEEEKKVNITNYPGFTVNRIREDVPADDIPLASIELLVGDGFCAHNKINHLSFLKIDTEGYDLKVLKGFDKMITEHRIDFVQVEAGMTPLHSIFVGYNDFYEYFQSQGYFLFRITNQSSDDLPITHRADVVFISKTAAERYRFN